MFGIPDFPMPQPDRELVEQIPLQDVTDRMDATKDTEAIEVLCEPDEPAASVTGKVRQAIAERFWWLQEYWHAKGPPVQHLVITGPLFSLHTYVFGKALEKAHIQCITDAVRMFAQLCDGVTFRALSYLLFDDTGYRNSQNGLPALGWAGGYDYIVLFPASRSFTPYRIEAITQCEGALIHEFTHKVLTADEERARSGAVTLRNRWRARFHWKFLSPESGGRVLLGGGRTWEVIEEPTRCVTAYATSGPGDDFCESLVAALRAPSILDVERLQFLRTEVLPASWHEVPVTVREVELAYPVLCQPVAFTRRRSPVRVIS